jgi:hypothetical protein
MPIEAQPIRVVVVVADHVVGQAGPQQGDHGAAAMIRMDAGAADFHHALAQVLQAVDVELVFRVVIADATGGGRGQDAVGADDAAGFIFAHDQVIAETVVMIDVMVGKARLDVGAEFLDEDLVTQSLGFADILLAVGEGDTVTVSRRQPWRECFVGILVAALHGVSPFFTLGFASIVAIGRYGLIAAALRRDCMGTGFAGR